MLVVSPLYMSSMGNILKASPWFGTWSYRRRLKTKRTAVFEFDQSPPLRHYCHIQDKVEKHWINLIPYCVRYTETRVRHCDCRQFSEGRVVLSRGPGSGCAKSVELHEERPATGLTMPLPHRKISEDVNRLNTVKLHDPRPLTVIRQTSVSVSVHRVAPSPFPKGVSKILFIWNITVQAQTAVKGDTCNNKLAHLLLQMDQ